MNNEQRLNHVADGYRAQRYKVVVQPGPDDLPDFAKDFKIEIVARRDDGCVLASVKGSQSDLEADREIPRYAEITSTEPGWRFDVFLLGSESQPMPDKKDAKEPSEEDIRRALEDVERILQAGFEQQALIAAWAALESAMRRRLHAEGEEAGWGSSPRTMLNELYSAGALQISDFRRLEGLFQSRSAIVHGFTTPVIERSDVQFLVETTRRFLDESRLAKKTA
jgi:REase_AHJR-like protein